MADNNPPAAAPAARPNLPQLLKLDETQLNKIRITERNRIFKEEKGSDLTVYM